ncbi:amidase [Sodalis sp. RH15]|uniref:amidase n=1 Tax=Sodalis sp. RH15 TaxID=3394330 RepID=UPI0039B48964
MLKKPVDIFAPATLLAKRIREGEITSLELVTACLEQIEKHNGVVNAVVILLAEQALARAHSADKALAGGEVWGPLHGVPLTVKESWDVKGLPSTFGLVSLRDNIAGEDALAVSRLKAAGAILVGKTNVPPHLGDWQTIHPDYGTTRNPWDVARTPGGSSGGSAAALASGFSALEIGSDIGGSIRMPAHYCGVYGHKPSYGLVPGRGHGQPGKSAPADITVYGPLSRSAADLDLALGLLAQPDTQAWPAWRVELDSPAPRMGKHFRVGVWANDSRFPVDNEISAAILEAAESLRRAGVEVEPLARPDFTSGECYEVYVHLLRGATSARQNDKEFAANRAAAAQLAADDKSYRALSLRGNVLTHRDWLGYQQRRYGLIEAWRAYFARFDFLLCPAASTTAFTLFDNVPKEARYLEVNGRRQPSANDYFWLGLSSAAYLPATTLPIALSSSGLPISAQIIGRFGADRACIALADIVERVHHRFATPPMFTQTAE